MNRRAWIHWVSGCSLFIGIMFVFDAASSDAETPPDWLSNVQIYNVAPVELRLAETLRLSVNGLWGGFLSTSPVRPKTLQKLYKTDEEFVSAMHRAGYLVSGAIPGVAGHPAVLKEWPELKRAACVGFDGEPPYLGRDHFLFMCNNNPLWVDWQIAHGRKAIDAGVDLITLDEPQGSSLSLSPSFGRPGFCSYCMDGFREYVKNHPGLPGAPVGESFDFRKYLIEKNLVCPVEKIKKGGFTYKQVKEKERALLSDPWVEEYLRYQIEANVKVKRRIISNLRSYARSKGKDVAITANLFGLDTQVILGHAMYSLPVVDQLDFLVYENIYSTGESWGKPILLPRGKWVAWHKLAHSIKGVQAVALPAVPLMVRMHREDRKEGGRANYFRTLFFEAYATGNALSYYNIGGHFLGWGGSKVKSLWKETVVASSFVSEHREYFEGLESRSSVGILYLYNLKWHGHSYLGTAQALAESNIPFEVVFSGDGVFIPDELTAERLMKYRVVVVPSLRGITDNQRKALEKYVEAGGNLVLFNSHTSPMSGERGNFERILLSKGVNKSGISKRIKILEDVGLKYFDTYEDQFRDAIQEAVIQTVGRECTVNGKDRDLIAYVYAQPDHRRTVIHLVNYAYVPANDCVTTRAPVVLQVRCRNNGSQVSSKATLLTPEQKAPQQIAARQKGDNLEVVVPTLGMYAIVVLKPGVW